LDFGLYVRMLGNRTVRSISTRDLDGLFATLKTSGRSPRTLQRHLVNLREFWRWAVRRGYADTDVTEGFRFRPTPTKVRRALSLEEQRRLLEAARDEATHVRLAVFLALRTGLRYANVVDMRWDWLDLESGTITVPASEYKGKRDYVAPLADDVLRVLRIRFRLSPAGRTEWVFGRPGRNLRKSFLRALERAGIERDGSVDFHALRTTWSTLLAPVCSYPCLKALMGHSPGGDVTMVYPKPPLEEMRDALNRMPRA